ncbi:MAG: hypothetical protein KDC34_09780 [Saprospiraceae bacterium]|nr:hypothetical protein [Saprospiraceae bacterium]
MPLHFADLDALKSHFQNKENGFIVIDWRNCPDYEGMALSIMLVFDTRQSRWQLDLQWISLGLDPYGDTLQESYVYQFTSLDELLEYLLLKYQIKVTDIPIHYQFDPDKFPDPVKDGAKKALFEASWKRFQHDFLNGAFFDPALTIVYNSLDN